MTEMSHDREQLMSQQSRDTEQMIARFSTERDELNAEMTRMRRDYDEQLATAQHDKRQVTLLYVVLLSHSEKASRFFGVCCSWRLRNNDDFLYSLLSIQ